MRRFFFFALFLAAAPALADPRIVRLDARAHDGNVSVQFALQNGFSDREIVRALQSGVATGFTYRVELVRKRPNWFDKTMATSTIDVICTYNSLTREYLLNYRRDKKLVRSETFHDFALLQQRMTNVSEPELFRLANPRPYKYRVRVRAEMGRRVTLFVVPAEITTGWEETRIKSAGSGS